MPVFLAQMNDLERNYPNTWNALNTGDFYHFVVQNSTTPFTALYTNQALEQEIKKKLKRHGGIVGISQNDEALDRLVTIAPTLCKLVNQFTSLYEPTQNERDKEHHHFGKKNTDKRVVKNAKERRNSIETHCNSNLFKASMPLKTIASSTIIPEELKRFP